MTIVVTGASGFVGRELVALLASTASEPVVGVQRKPARGDTSQRVLLADLLDAKAATVTADAAGSGGTLIHLAALTPGQRHTAEEYAAFNADMTERLAQAAVAVGAKRFVYVSSTHVCGTLTNERAIDEDTPTALVLEPYGASKLAGETAARRCTANTPVELTIVRVPLVYGPGVKGSLAGLTRAVVKGVPLPLGSIKGNQRDMIGVANLAAFLSLAATHTRAANQVFVVRDGEPVSTHQLVSDIAAHAGRTATLLPVPKAAMGLAQRLPKIGPLFERLTGDHRVDDAKARVELGWVAPKPMSYDLGRMVQYVISTR